MAKCLDSIERTPIRLHLLTLFTALLLAVTLLAVSAPDASAEGVSWTEISVEDALKEAGKRDTLVMVDVYATWCGPCHKLDRETFPTKVVGEATKDFVRLKIDGEKADGEKLVEKYNVVGYPTVLFIRPDGEEVERIFGYVDADTFAGLASGFEEGRGTLEDVEAKLDEAPTDRALRMDAFMKRVVRGHEKEALAHAAELRKQHPSDHELAAELHFTLGKYLYLRGKKDYGKALEYFAQVTENWPDSSWASRTFYPRARALLGAGDEDRAFAELKAFVEANADAASAYNTAGWFCVSNHDDFAKGTKAERMAWGLEMANVGLEKEPTNAGLLDTKAELLFLTGDKVGAIEAIKAAIAAADDPYFRQQLERFERG